MSCSAILEVHNFDFSKFEPFLKYQKYQKWKLKVSKIVKMAFFEIEI